MSGSNETRHIEWYQTCKFKCKLDANVCNNKQRCNKDKCRCECKELIDKGRRDKRFVWYLSNCERECDKSCDIGQYLEYKNCKCRKKLISKLVEECKIVCNSCTIYVVLLAIFFIISINISTAFIYFHWYFSLFSLVSSLVKRQY